MFILWFCFNPILQLWMFPSQINKKLSVGLCWLSCSIYSSMQHLSVQLGSQRFSSSAKTPSRSSSLQCKQLLSYFTTASWHTLKYTRSEPENDWNRTDTRNRCVLYYHSQAEARTLGKFSPRKVVSCDSLAKLRARDCCKINNHSRIMLLLISRIMICAQSHFDSVQRRSHHCSGLCMRVGRSEIKMLNQWATSGKMSSAQIWLVGFVKDIKINKNSKEEQRWTLQRANIEFYSSTLNCFRFSMPWLISWKTGKAKVFCE